VDAQDVIDPSPPARPGRPEMLEYLGRQPQRLLDIRRLGERRWLGWLGANGPTLPLAPMLMIGATNRAISTVMRSGLFDLLRAPLAETEDGRDPIVVANKDRIAYHLAEFTALKSEIGELIRQSNAYLTYAIATSGGVAAWLLTHPEDAGPVGPARWRPLTVSFLFGLLSLVSYVRIGEKGAYLRKLEDRLGAFGLGWEREIKRRPRMIFAVHVTMWGALNLAGALIGWYL
jgi:hypothetical protein